MTESALVLRERELIRSFNNLVAQHQQVGTSTQESNQRQRASLEKAQRTELKDAATAFEQKRAALQDRLSHSQKQRHRYARGVGCSYIILCLLVLLAATLLALPSTAAMVQFSAGWLAEYLSPALLPSFWLVAWVCGAALAVLTALIIIRLLSFRLLQALIRRNLAQTEKAYHAQETVLGQAHQQALQEQAAATARTIDELGEEFDRRCRDVQSAVDEVTGAADGIAPAWGAVDWAGWQPSAEMAPIMRLGTFHLISERANLTLPAVFDLHDRRPLLLLAPPAARNAALQSLQAVLFRLLASLPPGTLRFTFLDPVGLGQSAAPLARLGDYDDKLITGKVWSETAHIDQRLADLTEHMENIIQKCLRNQYSALEHYNSQAGEIAEPYRALVAFDVPAKLSEAALHRLESVVQHGARCGVFALLLADPGAAWPYGFSLDNLATAANVIAWEAGRFVWKDPDFQSCALELEPVPADAVPERIVSQVGEAAQQADQVAVPFGRIAPPREAWWTGSSVTGLRIALGPAGGRKVQYLELGQGLAHHALVVGKTGSGKSSLFHTLITNLALTYPPEEAELYLVDFKKGVEFKVYADARLPHARVIAIESEREFGLSVLQGLDKLLNERGLKCRNEGTENLAVYRQKTGAQMPRVVLLVDEFQEFFTEDDPLANQAAQILDRLVRQGRSFGIHIILGSQTLAGSYTLARSTIDQMAIRIALQCSEADSRLILSDDNPAARLLSRPGEAVYNAANGLVEGNNHFQVAWLTSDDREKNYLPEIRGLAQTHGLQLSQIVFEGNRPADVRRNRQLLELLDRPPQQKPSAARLWLGEPVAIRDPVAALLSRRSGGNFLVVGKNDDTALSLMAYALISLAAQYPAAPANEPASAHFLVFDFGTTETTYADWFSHFSAYSPQPIRVGSRQDLPQSLEQLAAEVKRRTEAEAAGTSAAYLFIHGLHRARDLRSDDSQDFSSFGDASKPPSPAQLFAAILRDGPEVGVHTLVWCDTATNLTRTLDRQAVREFGTRAVLQMGAEDSANLIETPAASKLGPNRALYYSEDDNRLEKFRPYAVPAEDWLQSVVKNLTQTSSLAVGA